MRRRSLVVLMILLMFAISGCWDIEDLDDRAPIIALGLDAAPNNMVMASAQVPLFEPPPVLGASASEKSFHTITSIAKTSYGAATGLENKAAKSIFWGHLKAVVVNSALAERGLKQYCSFLERLPQIRPQCLMVLTSTTTQDLLSVSLSSKMLPGLAIFDFLMLTAKWDEFYPMPVWIFTTEMENGPVDPFLPIISYDQEEQVFRSEGLAVFHRDRLVGKLSENESRMALLIMGKAKNAYLTVPVPGMGEITLHGMSANSRLKICRIRPKIVFQVEVKANGMAGEITSDRTNLKTGDIKKIEHAIAASLKKDMLATIRHLQQVRSDIIGFGDTVRADQPTIWKKLNWDQEYPRLIMQLKVRFNLEQVGEYR